jgi:uncharacterized protein YdhG (YjbR/CyaY superfamily)
MEKRTTPADIDSYIAAQPAQAARQLRIMRKAVREEAPDAVEAISYGIPTYKLDGNLVHFAGHKKHIGMYPPVSEAAPFKKQLARYETESGTLRFPLDEPLPLPLIRKIVRFFVKERRAKMKAKLAKKKTARKRSG